jgi:hypothetical protein
MAAVRQRGLGLPLGHKITAAAALALGPFHVEAALGLIKAHEASGLSCALEASVGHERRSSRNQLARKAIASISLAVIMLCIFS